MNSPHMIRTGAGREEGNKTTPASATGSEVPRSIAMLSRYMDEAFRLPGGFRIGWDGIIGLIPGVGDVTGMIISSYIILRSSGMGVPKSVLARMSLNVLLETVIGAIPLLGDIFDIAFKANVRNMKLLEKYQQRPDHTRKSSKLWVGVYAVAGLFVLGFVLFVVFSLFALLFKQVF